MKGRAVFRMPARNVLLLSSSKRDASAFSGNLIRQGPVEALVG